MKNEEKQNKNIEVKRESVWGEVKRKKMCEKRVSKQEVK